MSGPVLKAFTVHLHRRGGKTKECFPVEAKSLKHAERVAVALLIERFPDSKPRNWVVDFAETL